jgi:hypothetical protein
VYIDKHPPGPYPAYKPWLYVNAPTELHWGDITVDNSTGASVWLGQPITDTSSKLYLQNGNASYVSCALSSDIKFDVSDISWQITSAMSTLNASGTFAGWNYGADYPIEGIDYGPDGVPSLDDTYYNRWNPAPGTTKVNKFTYVGVATGLDATNVGLDSVRDWVEANPFSFTTTYSVNVGSDVYASSLTQNVVPEPMTLSLLGLGGLVLARRRKCW